MITNIPRSLLVKRQLVFYTPVVPYKRRATMTTGVFWKSNYGGQVTSDLTAQEKELRDTFVREYLIDFDPIAACIRCGFLEQYASQYAMQFMGETYVRKQIAHVSTTVGDIDEKTKTEQNKQLILTSLFREANYRGAGASHGSRVAALAKLASIHGMDAPTKMEQTINHKGGVMAVPGIAAIDDWETQAVSSQAKLTSEAEN